MKALSNGKRKPSAVLRLQRTPFDSVADKNLRDVKTCGGELRTGGVGCMCWQDRRQDMWGHDHDGTLLPDMPRKRNPVGAINCNSGDLVYLLAGDVSEAPGDEHVHAAVHVLLQLVAEQLLHLLLPRPNNQPHVSDKSTRGSSIGPEKEADAVRTLFPASAFRPFPPSAENVR